MRVIAGKARRLPLKCIEGLETRPTTDRIKETLFNILQPKLWDCTFLDLFAGSGAIGIEALSRGAQKAVFVEQNRRAVDCILENLRFTQLSGNAQVLALDAMSALKKLEGGEAFSFIYLDPPYDQGLELQVLEYLRHSTLADPDTRIILETSLKAEAAPIQELGYQIWKEKHYKTNKHLFLMCTGE